DLFPAIIGLFAAISMAAAHVTLRYLRLSDHYLVIINYFAYISGVASLIILLFQRNLIIPSLPEFLVLIFLGIVGLFSQITLTKAYQLAPASLVSLYSYLEIIFTIIFSILFFKEIPNILSIGGASFIIISGYLYYSLKVTD
ncbi:MAG: DMT family transporter, partial [Candidatus Atribacteria bacterium]|nr:DMT family transporter [Candidatus Atribacteria bacterium]